MTRRACARLGLVLALAAFLALPAAASAVEDIKPTVAVTATLGGKAKECLGSGCGYFGGRKLTITWNASCNTEAPGLSHSVFVTLNGRPYRAGAKPVVISDEVSDDDAALSGSTVTTLPPGIKGFAEVAVECSYTTTDAEDNTTPHTGMASGISADVFSPPALTGFNFPNGSFCGVNVPASRFGKLAQAGQSTTLEYGVRYSALSMLPRTTTNAKIAGVRLHGRGAGLNFKIKPERHLLRRGAYAVFLKPKRGGTLKIWATIGGVKTNTLKIKVLPKRC